MTVRLLDLDLARPRPLPDVSARHRWIRLFVTLDGAPIGFVTTPYEGQDLEYGKLRHLATSRLSPQAWEALTSRRLASRGEGTEATGDPEPISVVVCTRDRPRDLEACLAALSIQRHPRYEVVVVDNAPTDSETRKVVERWSARYVLEPRPGLDLARNRGLDEAMNALVAFTDDDARPDPGWIEGIAAGFASPDVQVVCGLVIPAELETRAQRLFEDLYGGMGKGFSERVSSRRGRPMTYSPERYGVGCNMAFRREALRRIGGFDPALDAGTATGGGGELDAFQRLAEADAAFVYRPDALVRHRHRRSMARLRRQLFDNGRSYSAVLTAAFLRARGGDRLRVVGRYWGWVWNWHLRRLGRKLVGREQVPLQLVLVELAGAPLGPFVYWKASHRARKLAAVAPGNGG